MKPMLLRRLLPLIGLSLSLPIFGGDVATTIVGTWVGQQVVARGRLDANLVFTKAGTLVRTVSKGDRACVLRYKYRISGEDHILATLKDVTGVCSSTDFPIDQEEDLGVMEVISDNEILWESTAYKRQ